MNDWLDYKGSGSYRAYANDTLVHSFTSADTFKKQEEANDRLLKAQLERSHQLKSAIQKARKELEDAEMQLEQLRNDKKKKQNIVWRAETNRDKYAKNSPGRAYEAYDAPIKNARQAINAIDQDIKSLYLKIGELEDKLTEANREYIAFNDEVKKIYNIS